MHERANKHCRSQASGHGGSDCLLNFDRMKMLFLLGEHNQGKTLILLLGECNQGKTLFLMMGECD